MIDVLGWATTLVQWCGSKAKRPWAMFVMGGAVGWVLCGYVHRPPPDDFIRHAVWLNQPGPPTDLDLINADSSRTDDILVGAVPDTTARWWLCFTSRASDVTSIVQVADYGGAVLSLSDGPPFRQATRVLRNEKTATYCHPDNSRGYVGALFSRPTVWRMVRLDGDR